MGVSRLIYRCSMSLTQTPPVTPASLWYSKLEIALPIMGHDEPFPPSDLEKPQHHLPMQAVRNDSSTTTKIRAVFDASARSSSGVSLSDTLLVGPTIDLLVDVLLQFQLHRIALIADVSKMYRAIELAESDRDFHHFVWRTTPSKTLQDYCITRVTFGISPSPSLQACQAKCN